MISDLTIKVQQLEFERGNALQNGNFMDQLRTKFEDLIEKAIQQGAKQD